MKDVFFLHKDLTTNKNKSFKWTQDLNEAYQFIDENFAIGVINIHCQLQNINVNALDVIWIDEEEPEEDPF